ncbi:hypothetical protein KBI23_14775 [bacterium]|nr:hypothetical protein [bacterium]MBP9808025.1 hypothetical protein [bacterium]
MNLNRAIVAGIFGLVLTQAPLLAALASEREANGWIYSNLEDAGLKFTYPAAWKKTMIGSQPAEKDNILKVSGQLTGSAESWAELSLLHSQEGMSPALLVKIMEEAYWSKLPEYKGSLEKSIRLPGAQAAVEKETSFRQSGVMFSQRCLVFQIGPKSYSLIMTCPLSEYHASGTIWNTAVNSIAAIHPTATASHSNSSTSSNSSKVSSAGSAKASAGRGSSSSSSSSADTASGDHAWHTKDGTLSFAFPSSLKEAVVEGDDHLLKASCEQPGKVIGLDVYRGDAAPNVSLGELSTMLEEKYFLPLKNYQKIGEEQRSIGSGGSVPGVVRESTFETNGVKMHHLSGYIMVDKNLYAVCLSTAGVNYNEAHQIWSRVASSVTVKR